MKMVSKELTNRLDANSLVSRPIQGIAWYNIVANPDYTHAFAYVPTANPRRSELIVDDDDNEDNDCEQSDMVAMILNLAFMKEEAAREMTFGTGMSNVVKSNSEQLKTGNKYAQLED